MILIGVFFCFCFSVFENGEIKSSDGAHGFELILDSEESLMI